MAGRARTGWDVTSGALCIVGIRGRGDWFSSLGSGAGRRGERRSRRREARRWAGGPARSAEKGASGREGTGRTPLLLPLPPPPPSRPVGAAWALATRRVPATPGSGCLFRPRVHGAAGPGGHLAAHGDSGSWVQRGPRRGCARRPPGACGLRAGSSLVCSKSKPGSQLVLEPRPPARA